ncbi:hypothetical protein MTZ49_10885 [Entomomonas sp. E2T0]|uniref:hypothetical protein n=1 Tax=Entomomonas sp. E2T0 TaxID=2930213 RepID=UPI0022283313|nr:hypothetical protein [Entomomonas sp. E2T0]UYZ83106.1 hypothetical protein MTZ49_10885 [Entomomonas sp. E2T0]
MFELKNLNDKDIKKIQCANNTLIITINAESILDTVDDEGVSTIYLFENEVRYLLPYFTRQPITLSNSILIGIKRIDGFRSKNLRYALFLKASEVSKIVKNGIAKLTMPPSILFEIYDLAEEEHETNRKMEMLKPLLQLYIH